LASEHPADGHKAATTFEGDGRAHWRTGQRGVPKNPGRNARVFISETAARALFNLRILFGDL